MKQQQGKESQDKTQVQNFMETRKVKQNITRRGQTFKVNLEVNITEKTKKVRSYENKNKRPDSRTRTLNQTKLNPNHYRMRKKKTWGSRYLQCNKNKSK